MKKQLLIAVLALVMVFSFSCGILADNNINLTGGDNQYTLSQAVKDGTTIEDDGLYIATVGAYKAENLGATTFFKNGEAINDDDIIISNGKVAVVLAVETRNPWGYPGGSVLDAGYIKAGVPQNDTVWAIEFLAHRWDSWAPANCGVVDYDIVNYDFGQGAQLALKVTRHWTNEDVILDSYYGIDADAEYIKYYTEITNNGDEATGTMKNDYAITNKGDDGAFMGNLDYVFATGNYGNVEGKEFSTYIFLPETEKETSSYFKGSLGYKELVSETNLAAGESRTLGCYIVIDDEPSTAAVNALINETEENYTHTISGKVTDANGEAVPYPVVIIKEDDSQKVVGWVIGDAEGNYEAEVEAYQDYDLFVERDGFGAGESRYVYVDYYDETLNLESGVAKETVKFNLKDQDGNPVWGKVVIADAYPTVRFCGDSVYQAAEAGVVEAEIAGDEYGDYIACVFGEGYWFYNNAFTYYGNVEDTEVDLVINEAFEEPNGWLSADMHHHGNKNDGFAFPEEVIQSILAAGLDVGFITDHDFTVNNYEGYTLAQEYGLVGFLPSEEITCSWAHFNVLPLDEESYEFFLDESKENHVMDQFSELPEFVAQTHEAGASITANHPWYSYGLFTAAADEIVPGGYTDDFDCIEINACNADSEDVATLNSLFANWNAYLTGESAEGFVDADGEEVVVEKPHYVVGGSDTHDVLHPGFVASNLKNNPADRTSTKYQTGKIRTFGFVGVDTAEGDIEANGLQFTNAVNAGHSYVSYGPVLDMNYIPGYTYEDMDGVFEWEVNAKSLERIVKVVPITDRGENAFSFEGGTITADFDNTYVSKDTDWMYLEEGSNWYDCDITVEVECTEDLGYIALLIIDENGNYAITNPCWIQTKEISDVDTDSWYAERLQAALNYDIVNGYPDGTFQPNKFVTRAEFAQMVYKFVTDDRTATYLNTYYDFLFEETKDCSFSDVKDGAWYAEAVLGLANAGLISGYPDGTFQPNKTITRAEIVAILNRITGELPDHYKLIFSDIQGKWYQAPIDNLAMAGLISGYIDGTFKPENLARRCEAVQFIFNLIYYNEYPVEGFPWF